MDVKTMRPPQLMRDALATIGRSSSMNDAVEALKGRANEFASPLAARLTGVALNPVARDFLDNTLDEWWAEGSMPTESPEIVVGSGLHAAIYCAVRVMHGHPKPLVIEAKERVGGAFAVSRKASFYLNSRNRPGDLGVPGREEALNVLPGALVQPADLSGDEYQPNDALAFSIRTALAMYAKVITGQRVVRADNEGVTLESGRNIKARRVLFAPGLGEPYTPNAADGEHLVNYMQFLARMDQPFPFQGLKRVAVVGAGDSGRTVVEALLGQGPSSGWSVAALDYVERIDWYGVPSTCLTKALWRKNNRSRYQGISRFMPRGENGLPKESARITPIEDRGRTSSVGYRSAYVNGNRYDLVVWATGFEPVKVDGMTLYRVSGREVARTDNLGVFIMGPAAQVDEERPDIRENEVAVFRYADRTAALAMHLPGVNLPPRPESEVVEDREGWLKLNPLSQYTKTEYTKREGFGEPF